jgi:hypothetical protein
VARDARVLGQLQMFRAQRQVKVKTASQDLPASPTDPACLPRSLTRSKPASRPIRPMGRHSLPGCCRPPPRLTGMPSPGRTICMPGVEIPAFAMTTSCPSKCRIRRLKPSSACRKLIRRSIDRWVPSRRKTAWVSGRSLSRTSPGTTPGLCSPGRQGGARGVGSGGLWEVGSAGPCAHTLFGNGARQPQSGTGTLLQHQA